MLVLFSFLLYNFWLDFVVLNIVGKMCKLFDRIKRKREFMRSAIAVYSLYTESYVLEAYSGPLK